MNEIKNIYLYTSQGREKRINNGNNKWIRIKEIIIRRKIQNKPQKPGAGAISMTRHDMLKINLITIH